MTGRYSYPGMMRFPEIDAAMDTADAAYERMPWIGGHYRRVWHWPPPQRVVEVLAWSGLADDDTVAYVTVGRPGNRSRCTVIEFNRRFRRIDEQESNDALEQEDQRPGTRAVA